MASRLQKIPRRVQSELITRLLRSRGILCDTSVRFIGYPIVDAAPGSEISIGQRTWVVSHSKFTPLGVHHATILRTMHPRARLSIGEHVGMSGATICCVSRIEVGHGCLLGANVMIVDSDFHPLDSQARRYAPVPEPQPDHAITIGTNVFIGTNAMILKGVSIGANSVIGAGSVVSGDIPADVVAAGNPARPIRSLSGSNRR